MTGWYDVAESRVVPAGAEDAFRAVIPIPLTRIFAHRFGPIPPIRDVLGQDGEWGTPGQTRTIVLADGGRMREELTAVDEPSSFDYRITGITGPMRPLVAEVEGRWVFEPEGTTTRITWSWRIRPRPAGRLLMPVFGWFWRGYARRALATIEAVLHRG
ncbi:SRPBCC family protein [Nocardioides terrisoli]|uniref:SRPBCC family protein n=1 Tax=Nocardioides terrisoli TaxID=3388267 RepID=UPI00287BB250|nr:SRPBCC family protein [Nocardioides marmorisolisilvae]